MAERLDWSTSSVAALWSNARHVNNCIRARGEGEYLPYRVRWKGINRGAGDATHPNAYLHRGEVNTIANVCAPTYLESYKDGIRGRRENVSSGSNSPISAFMSVGGVGLTDSY